MWAPAAARAWQMRCPSPPLPPVTTATVFLRSMPMPPRVDVSGLPAQGLRLGGIDVAGRRRLPSEDAAATVGVRAVPLFGDQLFDGWACGGALEPPGLLVQALDRPELFVAAELGAVHRGFEHLDRLV